jgi:hypothetical protein
MILAGKPGIEGIGLMILAKKTWNREHWWNDTGKENLE